MARGRPSNQNYENKNFTGTFHWTDAQDWKFITVAGARCTSLFNVPFDTLQEVGIKRVEFEENIEVFAQRQEYTLWRGKQTKVNYDNYQIILLDFDYLYEWQSRFFCMMGWEMNDITKFLSEDTVEYIANRTSYFRKKETEKYAAQLAEQLGSTVELVMHHLLNNQEEITPVSKTTNKDRLKGELVKLGNEYFLQESAPDKSWKALHKLKRELLMSWLQTEYPNPASHLKTHLGDTFVFTPDLESEPPKSRGAVGWVKGIVSLEESR